MFYQKKILSFLWSHHPELSLFTDEQPTVQYGETPSPIDAMQPPP